MTPVTDVKPVRRVFRIVDAVAGASEPYNLLDVAGKVIDTGKDPRRLADYALEIGDEVKHDSDLIRWEQRPPPVAEIQALLQASAVEQNRKFWAAQSAEYAHEGHSGLSGRYG